MTASMLNAGGDFPSARAPALPFVSCETLFQFIDPLQPTPAERR